MTPEEQQIANSARKRGIMVYEHHVEEPERRWPDEVPAFLDRQDMQFAAHCGRSTPETFRRHLANATEVIGDLGEYGYDAQQSARFAEIASALDHLLDNVRQWMCTDERAVDWQFCTLAWTRLEMVRRIWAEELEDVRVGGEWSVRHRDPFVHCRRLLRKQLAVGVMRAREAAKAEAVVA